jgi:hypothetical protein
MEETKNSNDTKAKQKTKYLKKTILRYDRVCSIFQTKKLTRHV